MKRLLIAGSATLATTPATIAAIAAAGIDAGKIALYRLDTGAVITAALTEKIPGFTLFIGEGALSTDGKYMQSLGEVSLRRFSYTKTVYAAGTKFSANITIPTPAEGKDYTLTMAKKGVVFNERNKWSATTKAREGDTAATVAKRLGDQLKALGKNEAFGVVVAAGKITVTATNYTDWNLVAGDDLFGTTVTTTAIGLPPVCDDAYIKDLYRQCLGDEGVYGTDPSGLKLYSDPTISSSVGWTLYTLQYYNPKPFKTTTGEDVRQIVHIAIPAAAATTLDAILASFINPAAAVAGDTETGGTEDGGTGA